MNRIIKFRAKCLETSIVYDISTVDEPRDKRGAHNFKGRQNNGGYWFRLVEGHPNANSRGYVCEHRLVMEEKLGRLLLKSEVVHHKDGDKMNNKIDNLEVCTNQKEHAKLHAKNIERQEGGFIKGDIHLEGKKFRLYNKSLKTTEIYTLSRLINTAFRNNTFEYRGSFTGLLDKNKKELYGSDIVLVDGRRTICKYIEGEFKLQWETDENKFYCIDYIGGSEVIGNIYSNPDLINKH